MPKIKKPLKTIEEDKKGKNLISINITTGKKTKNPVLIEKVKKSKLPGYEVVKPKKKDDYLRSLKNNKKIDNLDPKVKILKKK